MNSGRDIRLSRFSRSSAGVAKCVFGGIDFLYRAVLFAAGAMYRGLSFFFIPDK